MSKLMKMALGLESEDVPPQMETSVVMKGPLAEVMTQALAVAYARVDPTSGDPSAGKEPPAETGENVPKDAEVLPPGVPTEPKEETADPAVDPASQATTDDKRPDATAVSTESQAQDAALLTTLVNAADVGGGDADSSFMTIYGVDKDNVTPNDVVSLTQELDACPNPADFVLIMDATQPTTNGTDGGGEAEQRLVDLAPSLESIAIAYGAQVFPSLESFKESRIGK